MFIFCFFSFNEPATPESYTYLHTLSLHHALPIYPTTPQHAAHHAKAKSARLMQPFPGHRRLYPRLSSSTSNGSGNTRFRVNWLRTKGGKKSPRCRGSRTQSEAFLRSAACPRARNVSRSRWPRKIGRDHV